MKITMRKLRELLSEQAISRILNEEDDSIAHEEGASGDSIDSQIDRYFGQYEADAKQEPEDTAMSGSDVGQMESLDWRQLCKGYILTEAGEGDKDDQGPNDSAPGADGLTGDDSNKLGHDVIDIEKFANDVVRLIDNFESLLEVRSTILRRSKNFLKKNYDDEVLKEFEDTLLDDHGMEAGNDKGSINADKYPAPAADRANGSAAAGGAMGGGGGAP